MSDGIVCRLESVFVIGDSELDGYCNALVFYTAALVYTYILGMLY